MSDKALNRLRELRKKRGLSIRQLSEEIEKKGYPSISPDAISKYERGERVPKYEKLKILADFFGVKPTELMSKEMIGKARKDDLEKQFECLLEFMRASFRVGMDDETVIKMMNMLIEDTAKELPDEFKIKFTATLSMLILGTFTAREKTRDEVLQSLQDILDILKNPFK